MNADNLLKLARKNLNDSSSRASMADAIRCYDKGNLETAKMFAIESLAYSVGMFHSDYKKAWIGVFGERTVGMVSGSDFCNASKKDEKSAS